MGNVHFAILSVFSLPLTCGMSSYAHLYLGDVLARSAGSDSYTEVLSVHARSGPVCGVLAVRLAGLHVLRRLWSVRPRSCKLHIVHCPVQTHLYSYSYLKDFVRVVINEII